jgi:hypothetical protein
MKRADALIDAALTVQHWKRLYPTSRWAPSHRCWNVRVMRYLAHKLGCYPAWDAIEVEIVRRLLAQDEPLRRAA